MKGYPQMWVVYAPADNPDPEFWRWVTGIDGDRVRWKTFGTDGTHFDCLADWQEWIDSSKAICMAHPAGTEPK